ncbi:MAG: metallophosphoesterase [Candidatus Kuenenbacteria bacterium]
MKKKIKKIFLGIFILTIICIGFWSFFIEPNFIKIEKISINIENLPASFKGTKIVQLSDFHSKKFGKKEKKVLKILNNLNPDFIFITGDIIDYNTKDLKSCQIFWKELSKNFKNKIFAIYGNHDYWNQNFEIFDNLFKESKIEILNNQSKKLEKDKNFIYLIGVSEPYPSFDNSNYDNIQKVYRDNLQIAFKEVKDEKIPKILLAHSPEIFREIKNFSSKIDLTLVGHTHGGQIDIPFLVDFILPLKYDKKYKKGLFKENSKYLYVNRGVGESGLPIRFNSFPEITLIELRKQ